jgi:two-component system, OmpR family, response regulator
MTAQRVILFVDDDRDFLMAQRAFFEARGFRVLTAEDPDEAKQVLDTERPEIIFLDLMMEHYDDGFRLGREIRRREGFAETPLVMLSGVAAATGKRFSDEAAGLAAWSKLDQFVDKPVTGVQLLRIIEERTGAK